MTDGPRLNKLKQIYTKAIQQTTTNTTLQSDLLSLFKQHLSTYNVSTKLNLLDTLISNNHINLRDISSSSYIKEVYESYIVDDKSNFISYLNTQIEKVKNSKNDVENEVSEINSQIKEYDLKINELEEESKSVLEKAEQLESTF
ncbi:hypothetical protein CWI36_0223p0030 [Hamiltosporidium magnivora]|uniref:Uncharacterized protein n=1 Tax=Hamiltosporidium magnivora TaxID=148818 RepID=A0A4Q9LI35_9MICR|nr:hypothetical protein CWI36_0223p0030 [Hamiltosporidium magnivora]